MSRAAEGISIQLKLENRNVRVEVLGQIKSKDCGTVVLNLGVETLMSNLSLQKYLHYNS